MTTKKRRRVINGIGNNLPANILMGLKKTSTISFKEDYAQNLGRKLPESLSEKVQRSLDSINLDKAPKILDFSRKYHVELALACQIGQKCMEKLISLNLAFCLISDQHLEAIFGSNQKMVDPSKESVPSFPLLKLNLEHTSVTDLGLRYIALSCPQLTHINLKGCQKITNLSLSLLAQHCKNLKQVILAECKVSNYAVQIVAQESKENLQHLDLTDCVEISDETLSYLAYYCPNLKCLKLRGTTVTEQGLSQVIQRTALTELSLQGIPISDSTIALIENNQKVLQTLNVSFCHQITPEAIKNMCLALPFIKELFLFGLNFAPTLEKEFTALNLPIKVCL